MIIIYQLLEFVVGKMLWLGGTTKLIKNPEKHNTNDLYVHSVKLVNNTMFSKILYELLLNLKMDV